MTKVLKGKLLQKGYLIVWSTNLIWIFKTAVVNVMIGLQTWLTSILAVNTQSYWIFAVPGGLCVLMDWLDFSKCMKL